MAGWFKKVFMPFSEDGAPPAKSGAYMPGQQSVRESETPKRGWGFGKMVLGVIALFVVIGIFAPPKPEGFSNPTSLPDPGTEATPTAPIKTSCRDDWKSCTSNADFVNKNKEVLRAKVECRSQIEDSARYGDVDWGGWSAISFGTFTTGNTLREEGWVMFIDERARAPNAFGAMAKIKSYCQVNMRTGEIKAAAEPM